MEGALATFRLLLPWLRKSTHKTHQRHRHKSIIRHYIQRFDGARGMCSKSREHYISQCCFDVSTRCVKSGCMKQLIISRCLTRCNLHSIIHPPCLHHPPSLVLLSCLNGTRPGLRHGLPGLPEVPRQLGSYVGLCHMRMLTVHLCA
jgi:hypothetical protein